MAKKTHQALNDKPIARKLLAKMKMQWQRKVVNIKHVITGRAMVEELLKTVVSQKELAGFDPAHAAYVYTQNQVSVMSEQLTALKEMAPFVEIISKAEDLYAPSAPPMSPLTTSYFTCWAFFDACAGPADETIGTTILEVGAASSDGLLAPMTSVWPGRTGRTQTLSLVRSDALSRSAKPRWPSTSDFSVWTPRILPPKRARR